MEFTVYATLVEDKCQTPKAFEDHNPPRLLQSRYIATQPPYTGRCIFKQEHNGHVLDGKIGYQELVPLAQ